jgi:hypothetical protein
MAEEKKEEKKKSSEKLYGKGPKIEPAPEKGDTVKSEGGAPKEAAKEAEKSAGEPKSEATHSEVGKSGTEAKGDVMAGTDGIMTHHTQSGERTSVHNRHQMEMEQMHGRHEHEHMMRVMGHSKESHEEMGRRHHQEMKDAHSRHEKEHRDMTARHAGAGGEETPHAGMEEKEVGTEGTQK